jgi:hypothetical protein
MRSLLETEIEREGPKPGPCTKSSSELDPCLAWVQRERKAATNEAKFGVPFHLDC